MSSAFSFDFPSATAAAPWTPAVWNPAAASSDWATGNSSAAAGARPAAAAAAAASSSVAPAAAYASSSSAAAASSSSPRVSAKRDVRDYLQSQQAWGCTLSSVREVLSWTFRLLALEKTITADMPSVLLNVIAEFTMAAPLANALPHPRGPFHLNEAPWILKDSQALREWALVKLSGVTIDKAEHIASLAQTAFSEAQAEAEAKGETLNENMWQCNLGTQQYRLSCSMPAFITIASTRGALDVEFALRLLNRGGRGLLASVKEIKTVCMLQCEQFASDPTRVKCERCVAERSRTKQRTMLDFCRTGASSSPAAQAL